MVCNENAAQLLRQSEMHILKPLRGNITETQTGLHSSEVSRSCPGKTKEPFPVERAGDVATTCNV